MVPLSTGCRAPGVRTSGGPTSIDRLVQVYPELASGRFLVIADFEDERQMELFQLIGVSPSARCVLAPNRGRRDTGSAGLSFVSGSPNDTVVINNTYAREWYLKRDWRQYELLMMSVFAPQRGLSLSITAAGGTPGDRLAAETSVPLIRGWNVLRMDLAEIGEQIPIDDVQELRLSLYGAEKTVEVRIDDIILAGYRDDLLGDSNSREGGLYVQRVGRRWRIGAGKAGGDFEITFANGQIVEWFNMAADPYRLYNLVRGETLGPNPVPAGGRTPGQPVAARSRIVEMSPVRVVLQAEWYVTGDPAGETGAAPFRRWLYTVYPTGQLYVRSEAAQRDANGRALRVAIAVTPEAPWHTSVVSPSRETDAGRVPAYATARGGPAKAFLLFAIHDKRPASMNVVSRDVVEMTATVDRSADAVEQWTTHLLLGAADQVTDEEAQARALAYVTPRPCELEVGSFVADGFDPGSGCHVIAPDRGLVRFIVDPSKHVVFSPVFEVLTRPEQDVWVYVDHLIHKQVSRDGEGHAIFQLPIKPGRPTLVEVLLGRAPGSDDT